MSEYQNNTINIALHRDGAESVSDIRRARRYLFEAAVRLYRSLGGSEIEAHALLDDLYEGRGSSVADSVGQVMQALAIVSRNNDLDMMQAAYNLLDRERELLDVGR